MPNRTVERRFWAKVLRAGSDECWLWVGARTVDGYGRLWLGAEQPPWSVVAHRFSWTLANGPVPEGLQLDHLCRTRACVNPTHLEPVTRGENIRRGVGPRRAGEYQLAKTHCLHGHPYDGRNTYRDPKGKRHCRICMNAAGFKWRHRTIDVPEGTK